MGLWGFNYVLLEDGSGNILLENDVGLDAFPDKVLLERDETGAIANTDAISDSSNRYNVCQFSGFRALPDELVESGYGELVLPKYSEPRHMQDFVTVRAEHLEGSPRNEAPDVFIDNDSPVSADDY